MPSIHIVDLLVQGGAGQVGYVKHIAEEQIVENRGRADPDRIDAVIEYIKQIAKTATEARDAVPVQSGMSQITRITTDEFSFYPQDSPFTLSEYKAIIKSTASIANTLSPDIHMVLATFPVIWPDGGVHNCGLYVQAPTRSDDTAKIHHFSKKNYAIRDFQYERATGKVYRLTTDDDCKDAQLPNVVLKDTAEVLTDDINQYGAAIKITTSNNDDYISTIGICVDHAEGVEKKEVRGLIQQLQMHGKSIPTQCSHVITSYSIEKVRENIVSTVSHADPRSDLREIPTEAPKGFWSKWKASPPTRAIESIIPNPFSMTTPTVERYPGKSIGTLHSDLFLQACASDPSIIRQLNIPDAQGNTELHRAILMSDYDHELLGKRLYAMILAGGNPSVRNHAGKTVIELAREKSPIVRSYVDVAISKVELSNESSYPSLMELGGIVDSDSTLPNSSKLKDFILRGGNPYQQGSDGQSALDKVKTYPPFERVFLQGQLKAMFELVNSKPLATSRSAVAEQIDSLLVLNPTNFQHFFDALPREQRTQITAEIKANLPVFFERSDPGKVNLFLQCMEPQGSKLIGSFADFKTALSKLQGEENRALLFHMLQYKLHSFADYTSHEDLTTLLSESQVAWVKNIDDAGFKRSQLLDEYYNVEEECEDLVTQISSLAVLPNNRDIKMDEFCREKRRLVSASTSLANLKELRNELEATLIALSNDTIVPEIINKINQFNASTNPLMLLGGKGKRERVLTALLNVPVVDRPEIMNEALKTPEVDELRKALASHRVSKRSELNADGSVNEATAASSYKALKSKYLAQRKEHHEEQARDSHEPETRDPSTEGPN